MNNYVYANKLETLNQFRTRTRWKDEPLRGVHVPADQNRKIRSDGSFETLLGDTVLFDLPRDYRMALGAIRDELYRNHKDLFCTPLPVDSLHLTLHDLETAPFENLQDVRAAMQARRPKVNTLLTAFREAYRRPIRLRPTKLVSMVGRSVVLLFEPAEDADCDALMSMYERLSGVVRPDYPFFTPHVTLAYYKPQPVAGADAIHLGDAFPVILGAHPLDVLSLETGSLHYRCFTSMARYVSHDQFLRQTDCTAEEFRARMEFDNLYFFAQHRLSCGVSHYKVWRELSGFGLGVSTAKSTRMSRANIENMIRRLPLDILDPYANTPSCTGGVGGGIHHHFLCAVIIANLYERGLLEETAETLIRAARASAEKTHVSQSPGKEELIIHHCMFNLNWLQ